MTFTVLGKTSPHERELIRLPAARSATGRVEVTQSGN